MGGRGQQQNTDRAEQRILLQPGLVFDDHRRDTKVFKCANCKAKNLWFPSCVAEWAHVYGVRL